MPKYIFKYVEEHVEWLESLNMQYQIVKQQGMPKYIGFNDKKLAQWFRLRWA